MIDEYLVGRLTAEEVSAWALKVVVTSAWGDLPEAERHAVHLLFDLHDGEDTAWAPGREALKRCRDRLDVPPA
jgi:hypothetical protein